MGKLNEKEIKITINAKFFLIIALYLISIAVLVFDAINLHYLAKLAATLDIKIGFRKIFEFIFRVLFKVLIVVAIHCIAYKKESRKAAQSSPIVVQEPASGIAPYVPPQTTSIIKAEFPQTFNFGGNEYQKQKELTDVHIVGIDWAGNKENAASVKVGEKLFLEKREPSKHGANGVAISTEAGNVVGFLAKDLQNEILPLIEIGYLFLVEAVNSPLSHIAIGYYKKI